MDITAQNTFTPGILIQGEEPFDVSVAGTFVATVTLQRSKDNAAWVDVETFASPTEKTGEAGSAWYWRIGVKTGNYTSGTVTVNIYA
jgi:hypothetical protein